VGGGQVAPSYIAISALSDSRWVILTNGKVWRLYTGRVSASTTNYFEITLDPKNKLITKYLIAIFDKSVYDVKEGQSDIDQYFDEGKKLALELEEDLASTIMHKDALFVDIVKGILDHNVDTTYTRDELEHAKYTALRVMYRMWFVLYAESRNLLPVNDEKYIPISLRFMRDKLDGYLEDGDGHGCWKALLRLFKGIREGSVEHNLPQYDGELFKDVKDIEGISVRNKFIVKALRGILERDGEAVDYASLGVRHLGSIYESLLEFSVNQAEDDIMLLERGGKITRVKSGQESTYSYKKNSLYLAPKGGIAQRKTTGSYYTPDKIVEFLVKRGLEPIFEKRERLINADITKYQKTRSDADRRRCMDRLLDIQVLDPAMGSGHFLVEALNKITVWVTNVLKKCPGHPLIEEIESERKTILDEHEKNGITIDVSLLEDEVLLKRKIMKRCIFGVDLNPMAVDLAKLSLWLDSFAIGVPLTYMDHHIKVGDSTIGLKIEEFSAQKNSTIDDWIENPEKNSKIIESVWQNTDITIEQVKGSRQQYKEYQKQIRPHKIALDVLTMTKIDKKLIFDTRDIMAYLRRIAHAVRDSHNMDPGIRNTIEHVTKKSNKYRFFHWELEMMDAFTDNRSGFDLITGNPPWDRIRPNKREFFSSMDPLYNEKTEAEKKIVQQRYKKEFEIYKMELDEKREFYKNYKGIGENTDFDLWRIMMSRMIPMLARDGVFSMILPSALTNSRGATELRKHILSLDMLSLFVFENRKKIFPIHTRYRFALVSVRNSGGGDRFLAGFYLESLTELKDMTTKFFYSKSIIKNLSPKMSIIFEVKTEKELDTIIKIHSRHPSLMEIKEWTVKLGRELNLGEKKDKDLLVTRGGWPVLKSRNFHQYTHKYSNTKYANATKTLARLRTMKIFDGKSDLALENPRLVYRNISAAGNTRTMISCIAPHRQFLALAAYMALPRIDTLEFGSEYYKLITYLCGIFNSTTYDFILRPTIDKTVETGYLYETPVPESYANKIGAKISALSAKLFLGETWHNDMADALGLHKKSITNPTVGEKIQIVAELDSLAALQYGITVDEYKFVLGSFKTSKNKFSKKELDQCVDYRVLEDSKRNEHMRMFYGAVYSKALEYYDISIKNNRAHKGDLVERD